VDKLRTVLVCVTSPLQERDRQTRQRLQQLHGLADICEAALLAQWQDQDPNHPLSDADRTTHALLVSRLDLLLRQAGTSRDPIQRMLAAQWIGYIGLRGHQTGTYTPVGRKYSAVLARLVVDDDPHVRQAALQALPTAFPHPADVEQSLGTLLRQPDPSLRRQSAQSLMPLWRSVGALAAPGKESADLRATHEELLDLARAVVVVAGQGSRDPDLEVRRSCMEAIREVAVESAPLACLPAVGGVRVDLLPLAQAFGQQSTRLAQALGDTDAEVRLLACQAWGAIALLHQNLREAPEPLQSAFLLGSILQDHLPALVRALADCDSRVRLRVIDALEDMGPAAVPAAPALVAALEDGNPFVRWAAARTLGRVGPEAADIAVPALVRLLSSTHGELRLAAARSLTSYGPAARPALLALQQALASPEPELRLQAAEALGRMASPDAVPVLCAALEDPDERVRQSAAAALDGLPSSEGDVEALCGPPPGTPKTTQRADLTPGHRTP
jgi:HEAT repeat protein